MDPRSTGARILAQFSAAILLVTGAIVSAPLAYAKSKSSPQKENALKKKVGAQKIAIDDPCADPPGADAGGGCKRKALERTVKKLAEAKAGKATVRILHLGDSHVASDYITQTIRERLQAEYGNAGRGFTVIDQQIGYGGRRHPGEAGWERDRIVDRDREGRPFGFSGTSLESTKKGAELTFKLLGDEPKVKIFYQAQPEGGSAKISVDGNVAGELKTAADARKSVTQTFDVAGKGKKERKLRIVADGPKVRLYGISFEGDRPGVLYESIGPLGADAKVYTQLEPNSFKEHLVEDNPDLVVLMVGGNDAMKIRKGWTDLEKVKKDHVDLLDLLKTTLPNADCLVFGPMDAGEKEGKKIVSKTQLKEVRDMQKPLALVRGCAFFDMFESMGGQDSIARWVGANVMNADLVHPKEKAAELLGDLFFEAWEDVEKPAQ
jgi:lysophospholipase L1-like esterase